MEGLSLFTWFSEICLLEWQYSKGLCLLNILLPLHINLYFLWEEREYNYQVGFAKCRGKSILIVWCLQHLPTDSSAARIPFPLATMRWAISESSFLCSGVRAGNWWAMVISLEKNAGESVMNRMVVSLTWIHDQDSRCAEKPHRPLWHFWPVSTTG